MFSVSKTDTCSVDGIWSFTILRLDCLWFLSRCATLYILPRSPEVVFRQPEVVSHQRFLLPEVVSLSTISSTLSGLPTTPEVVHVLYYLRNA